MALAPAQAKKISEGKAPTQRGNPPRDGIYLLEISKLFHEDMHSGSMFIAEFRVVQSSPKTEGKEPNPKGEVVSFSRNLSKNEYAGDAINACLMGIAGVNTPDLFNDMVEHTDFKTGQKLNAEQPVRGMLVGLTVATRLRTKGTKIGEPWTDYFWKHIPDQTEEQQAKRRAELDAAGL